MALISVLSMIMLQGSMVFAEVPSFLKRWEASPKSAAFELPEKRGVLAPQKFTPAQLQSHEFIDLKDKARLELCDRADKKGCVEGFSTLEVINDLYSVNRFVGGPLENNILKLDAYKSGAAAVTPWSGHYWPNYEGGIGVRYGDKKFPHSQTFIDNFKYYQKNYSKDSRKISNLNELSPAEKYDLLIDDKDWSLTYYSWALGRRTYQLTGEVETWTGICHGWASAATLVPEPKKSFKVELPALKKTMQVYPDDVKALVSQLWATARLGAIFIGGRCDDKFPATDENGRIIASNCFDTNPASWHLALLNWVGKLQKSFIFDAVYDYQVWNQPVSSYKLSYFNPNTKETSEDLNAAMIPYSSFSNDPYQKYRSPKTKSIVGVELNLSYVVERRPNQTEGTSTDLPRIVEVTYYYDLEIDADNNVIGGEWYQAAHPDMVWRPTTARPLANEELESSYWNGLLPMSNDFINLSKKTSKLNQPLSAILDQLISWSKL